LAFLEKITAKYTLRERLQTLTKPKAKKGVTVMVGYSVPTELLAIAIKHISEILDEHGIKWTLPVTKTGHISVTAVTGITDEERDKIHQFSDKQIRPSFKASDIGVLKGGGGKDYLSLDFEVPNELKILFSFVRKLCGPGRVSDYRTWKADHRPHASAIVTRAEDRKKVLPLIPEMWERIKPHVYDFKPAFIEFFDKMELSEFYEIFGQMA